MPGAHYDDCWSSCAHYYRTAEPPAVSRSPTLCAALSPVMQATAKGCAAAQQSCAALFTQIKVQLLQPPSFRICYPFCPARSAQMRHSGSEVFRECPWQQRRPAARGEDNCYTRSSRLWQLSRSQAVSVESRTLHASPALRAASCGRICIRICICSITNAAVCAASHSSIYPSCRVLLALSQLKMVRVCTC